MVATQGEMRKLGGGTLNIGISGLGRIGRLVLRRVVDSDRCRLAAVDDRNDLRTILPLIQRDSVHGPWTAPWEVTDKGFGGVPLLRNMPFPRWDTAGVDIVLDCTGANPDGKKARQHLERGAKAVIISAPAPNVDATIVLGVNEDTWKPEQRVISMASCTTNAVAPILKMLEPFGPVRANLVSINAYTNAQRLVDAPHSDPRRARAAGLNIIPTASSTDGIIEKLFPNLRFSAIAYRVPVACGSVFSLDIELTRTASKIDLVSLFRYSGIIGYTEEPLVSSDIIGDSRSVVIDGLLLKTDGYHVRVVGFYDNEIGYASRLYDLAVYIGSRLSP